MPRLIGALVLGLIASSHASVSFADCFSPLQNDSFEAILVPSQTEYDQIPNWTLSEGARAVVYGSPGSLSSTPAGPDEWGSTYLDGGFSELATAIQRVEVPSECEDMYDQGFWWLLVTARLGDVVGEPDQARVEVRFLDAADQGLGVLQGCISDAGSGNSIHYYFVCSHPLPIGTRVVEFRTLLENVNGGRNTAWADNLSIGFTWPDPVVPTTWGGIKAASGRN
jgi:hypothetical protein